jgi:hypothetical protein
MNIENAKNMIAGITLVISTIAILSPIIMVIAVIYGFVPFLAVQSNRVQEKQIPKTLFDASVPSTWWV